MHTVLKFHSYRVIGMWMNVNIEIATLKRIAKEYLVVEVVLHIFH